MIASERGTEMGEKGVGIRLLERLGEPVDGLLERLLESFLDLRKVEGRTSSKAMHGTRIVDEFVVNEVFLVLARSVHSFGIVTEPRRKRVVLFSTYPRGRDVNLLYLLESAISWVSNDDGVHNWVRRSADADNTAVAVADDADPFVFLLFLDLLEELKATICDFSRCVHKDAGYPGHHQEDETDAINNAHFLLGDFFNIRRKLLNRSDGLPVEYVWHPHIYPKTLGQHVSLYLAVLQRKAEDVSEEDDCLSWHDVLACSRGKVRAVGLHRVLGLPRENVPLSAMLAERHPGCRDRIVSDADETR